METIGSSPSDTTNRFHRPELSEDGTWVTPVGELYESTDITSGDPQEPSLTEELAQPDFADLYHEGLIGYMLKKGYDNTYIIIANHQYNAQLALSSESDPIKRKAIQAASDRYLADNKEQLERTMAIRREYTQTLIDAIK